MPEFHPPRPAGNRCRRENTDFFNRQCSRFGRVDCGDSDARDGVQTGVQNHATRHTGQNRRPLWEFHAPSQRDATRRLLDRRDWHYADRKSTRLNSVTATTRIPYSALKKKKKKKNNS